MISTPQSLDGKPVPLRDFAGKVMLVVNTASKCGFTPQYEGLEALYEKYRERGFVVLGFPCNQFGEQEPGSASEIGSFCQKNYGVSFPMFEKIDVNGEAAHPLYQWLKHSARGLLGSEAHQVELHEVPARPQRTRSWTGSRRSPSREELERHIESLL